MEESDWLARAPVSPSTCACAEDRRGSAAASGGAEAAERLRGGEAALGFRTRGGERGGAALVVGSTAAVDWKCDGMAVQMRRRDCGAAERRWSG